MSEFRFIFQPQFGGDSDPYISESLNSFDFAESMMNQIANYTLHLHETGLMQDHSNYGLVQKKVNGEWIVIEDD